MDRDRLSSYASGYVSGSGAGRCSIRLPQNAVAELLFQAESAADPQGVAKLVAVCKVETPGRKPSFHVLLSDTAQRTQVSISVRNTVRANGHGMRIPGAFKQDDVYIPHAHDPGVPRLGGLTLEKTLRQDVDTTLSVGNLPEQPAEV